MSWAATIAAAVAVAGASYSAYSQRQQGKFAEAQSEADAEAEKARSRLEAQRVLEESRRTRSTAAAQAAESGLDLEIGTPVVIDEQIAYDANQDAWMTRLTGQSRAKSIQGAGTATKINANNQSGATLAQGLASAYGSYNTASKASSTTPKTGAKK